MQLTHVSNAGTRDQDHHPADVSQDQEPAAASPRRCDRPTRNGTPCRNTLGPWEMACRTHRDEADTAVGEMLRDAWNEGFTAGRASAPVRTVEVHRPPVRTHTSDGHQIVTVNGHYGYTWHDREHPLAIGDRVLIPGNWLFREPSEAVVNALGTTHDGHLDAILRRVQ